MKFETTTTIDQPADKVWAVLTHCAAWPEWDPSCERIEGEVALGQKVKAYSKLSPGRAFALKVTAFEPNRKMTWTGGMPLGLFKGERTFVLEELNGRTRFTIKEEFSGPMLKVIGKTIPDMSQAFDDFAAGLKSRSELVG